MPSRWQTVLIITSLALAAALSACAPPEPIALGYIGGLSGRFTDLGISGLNGARLAVEQRNMTGGIKGRAIKLIEEDDQQDPVVARIALSRLSDQKVAAIIGPMTSAMAEATLPMINSMPIVMLSPSVTSNRFSGIDDNFFRIIPATRDFVKTNAEFYFHQKGLRRIRLIYDSRNRVYSESWLKDFIQHFTEAGGTALEPLSFYSSDDLVFPDLARQALNDRPDGLVIIANSIDSAMLCQSIRRQNTQIALGTSEWAATDRLIELGSTWVENITVPQFFDRQSTQADYLAFRTAYLKRFTTEPGFSALFAFEAANTLFTALENKSHDQSLKEALLSIKSFAGTQRTISFDQNGDSQGKIIMSTVTKGRFQPVMNAP